MSDWVFLAAQRKSHSRTGFGATIGSRRSTGRKERVAHLHQLPPRGQRHLGRAGFADELRKHFSAEQVFQDIASIDPGADFPTVLEEALATAAVMLVVIGPRWLSATDKNGRKRLESPADFVHQEVAESLRSPAVRVFPLLVNGAAMPAEEELPDPLKPLARRNAIELTVRHWASDVAQLVQTLKRSPGVATTRAGDETPSRGPEYGELRREAAKAAPESLLHTHRLRPLRARLNGDENG